MSCKEREREKKQNRVLIPCHAFSLDLFSEMLTDRQMKECLKILIQIDLHPVVPRISQFELGCHVRREREQTNLIYSLFGNAHRQTNERVSKNLDLQAVVPRISQFELGCHVKRERQK